MSSSGAKPEGTYRKRERGGSIDILELKILLEEALEGLITRFFPRALCWKVLFETGGLPRT